MSINYDSTQLTLSPVETIEPNHYDRNCDFIALAHHIAFGPPSSQNSSKPRQQTQTAQRSTVISSTHGPFCLTEQPSTPTAHVPHASRTAMSAIHTTYG